MIPRKFFLKQNLQDTTKQTKSRNFFRTIKMTAPSNYVMVKTGFLTPEASKETIQGFVEKVVEDVKNDYNVVIDPFFSCSTKQSGRAAEKGTSEGLYGYTFVATKDVQLANVMRGLLPNGEVFFVPDIEEVEVKLQGNAWSDQPARVQIVEREIMREMPRYILEIAYTLGEQVRTYEDILNDLQPEWKLKFMDYDEMEDEDKLDELEEFMSRNKIAFDSNFEFGVVASLTSDEMMKECHFEELNRFGVIERFSPDKLTFFLRGETPLKIDGVKVKIEEVDGRRFLNDNGRVFPIDGSVVKLSGDETEAVVDQHGFIIGEEGERYIHSIIDKFTFNREIAHVSILWNTRDGISTGFANVSFKAGSNNAVFAVTQTRFMMISPPGTTSRVVLTSKLSKIQPPRVHQPRGGSSSRGAYRGQSSRGGSQYSR